MNGGRGNNEEMKKLKITLLIGTILLAAAGCSRPKALVYQDLRGIRVQQADFQQATIVLELQFYNPNSYGLSLKNGDVDAYLNDRYVGKATLDERTAVPARDTFTMPVSITAKLSSILVNALDIVANGGREVPVRLQGTIRAGKGGVFVPVKIHYEGRQRLNL